MNTKTKKKKGYVGKAGHLAVMGEFAIRGYNVAMPEVDYGDDIFVTEDGTGKLWRVQVKTATPTTSASVHPRSERFQIVTTKTFLSSKDDNPPVYVVFAMRTIKAPPSPRWRFLVIERKRLAEYHSDDKIGQVTGEIVKFDVAIHFDGINKGKVLTGKNVEITKWMERWDPWPVLGHA